HMFLRFSHRLTLAYADTSGYARPMRILGIETSCDETAVALIDAAGNGSDFRFQLLGHGLYSQAALHAPYGGVFPNLAKREHAKNLVPMLEQCLREANSLHEEKEGLRKSFPEIETLLAREPELYQQLAEFLETYEKPDIDALAVTHGP